MTAALPLLLALLVGPVARGAPPPVPPIHQGETRIQVRLQATVRPDLRTVVGELELHGPTGVVLEDALGRLPVPADDLWLRRTFPAAPEAGRLRLIPLPQEGRYAFVAVLPRRVDASGFVPGQGLYANGLWHPQPVYEGAAPVVDWQVDLALPEGVVGALNTAVLDNVEGRDGAVLRWEGQAERLALAVVPQGRVQRLDLPAGEVTLVDRGPARDRRDARLRQVLEEGWPGPDAPRMVVVETPSWRRLARPGPGLLFLSDRAFRVTDGLWRFHQGAVRRGLLRAGLPIADPWLRGFVADSLSELDGPAQTPRKALGWLSWIPQIDSLLYDGNLPYYGEVFDEPWPSDPVADDLLELVGPQAPGRVVAHRLDHRFGQGTAALVAEPLLSGIPLAAALDAAEVPAQDFDLLRAATPGQELRVDVQRQHGQHHVRVTRDAPAQAPAEPVLIEVDGRQQAWLAGPGPDLLELTLPYRPRAVVVDPHGDVDQHASWDRWPRRWTATVSAFPSELSLSDGRITAFADVVLRRQYDTRWLLDLGIATDPEDLVRADVGVIHYRGPLLNRRTRPLRLWAYAGPALLDPGYRPTDGAAVAVGGSLGVAWETRVDGDMPTRGYRLALGGDGGWVPGGGESWGKVQASATGVVPLGGRLALAGRVEGGRADGGVEHRLLALGGSTGVRGVPVAQVVGDAAGIGNAELRWEALRGASIPLWLAWLSHLQLTGGVDAGVLWESPGSTYQAVGWTAGLGGIADILGARPTYAGITVGDLLWSGPTDLSPQRFPEVYLRMDRAF
ncbi:outer membrane protein assembly factor [Myxococcota bacterium]|nr:outer membrane protein assembly factor [Myxococcota bacterium]